MAALSEQRSELAQQLISMQENTFRSISLELHDDFGQILTAIGAMLQRAERQYRAICSKCARLCRRRSKRCARCRTRCTRWFSMKRASKARWTSICPAFEKQTGIEVRYEKTGEGRELDRELSIHLYRVMQEALNNVARHSNSKSAAVRLRFLPDRVVLEVQDEGIGFQEQVTAGPGTDFDARASGVGERHHRVRQWRERRGAWFA